MLENEQDEELEGMVMDVGMVASLVTTGSSIYTLFCRETMIISLQNLVYRPFEGLRVHVAQEGLRNLVQKYIDNPFLILRSSRSAS